ncbi:MAG: hypothetical protein ABGY09_07970 [Euryarchaeota archaeon]
MRRLDLALAVLFTLASLAPMAPELRGEHAVVMDLAVHAHQVYLLGTAGLARGDWDPYSYTGRPPMIDYPLPPFLPAVSLFKLTGDPYLACIAVDALYRSVPCWVWLLLRRVGLATRRSDAAALVYVATLPAQVVEVFTVRVATTFSVGLAVTAILLTRSRIKSAWPALLAWSLSFLGNSIYTLPAFLLEAAKRPVIALSPIPAVPMMVLGWWYLHTAFTYAPGTWFLHGDRLSEKIILAMSIALLDAVTVIPSIEAGGGRFALATAAAGLGVVLAGPVGAARFVDSWRSFLPALVVGVSEARRPRERLARLAVLSSLMALVAFHAIAALDAFRTVRGYPVGPYRVLVDGGRGFEPASPVWTGWPVYELGGAFYQGASEPQLHALGPALEYIKPSHLASNWYMANAAVTRWFDERYVRVLREHGRAYLRSLPVRVVDVTWLHRPNPILPNEVGSRVIGRVRVIVNPSISLRDAVVVRRVRAIYVGSFSAYGVLWAELAGRLGRPPIIPGFYPEAVRAGQEPSPSEVPWTGEVLVVDRVGWRWAVKTGLVQRARSVIRVDYPLAPWRGGVSIDEAARRVLPYVSVGTTVRGVVSWRWDLIRVRDVGSGCVVIPWGWAPFWAVNGREGEACPVGPFTMVRTRGGGSLELRYVGWERHQRWAYLVGATLLLAVLVGAGRKSL